MKKIFTSWKNGSCLVFSILLLGVLGGGLTMWNYSRHVFSTRDAQVLDGHGLIAAFYPERLIKKIHPQQVARVTFAEQAFMLPAKAKVLSVDKTHLGTKKLLLVTLQLLDPEEGYRGVSWREDPNVKAGLRCDVTIDSTVPLIP